MQSYLMSYPMRQGYSNLLPILSNCKTDNLIKSHTCEFILIPFSVHIIYIVNTLIFHLQGGKKTLLSLTRCSIKATGHTPLLVLISSTFSLKVFCQLLFPSINPKITVCTALRSETKINNNAISFLNFQMIIENHREYYIQS